MLPRLVLSETSVRGVLHSTAFREWGSRAKSQVGCVGVAIVAADYEMPCADVCLLGFATTPVLLSPRLVKTLQSRSRRVDPETPGDAYDFSGVGRLLRNEPCSRSSRHDPLFRQCMVFRSGTNLDVVDLSFHAMVLERNLQECLKGHLSVVAVDIGQTDNFFAPSISLLFARPRLPTPPRRTRIPSLQSLSMHQVSTNDRRVYDDYVHRPSRSAGGGGRRRRKKRLSRSGERKRRSGRGKKRGDGREGRTTS